MEKFKELQVFFVYTIALIKCKNERRDIFFGKKIYKHRQTHSAAKQRTCRRC